MAGRVQAGEIGESDFDQLLRTLSATAKGRAFLAEYLRRFRPKETRTLLDALQRIEATVGMLRDQAQPERMGSELRRIAGTLDIASEDSRAADRNGEGIRRSALLSRASADLMALAESIASGVQAGRGAADAASSKTASVEMIEDDLVLLD